MKRTRVKICGICSVQDALDASDAGCDAIGLVFYEKSPRYVSITQAQAICQALPAFVSRVALFVNPSEKLVSEVLAKVHLDTLQFHGNEHPDYCQQFDKPYIKALAFRENQENQENAFMKAVEKYKTASSLLVDAFHDELYGGTGEAFDWSIIPEPVRKSIILAGGLTDTNVESAITEINPYALDVSSGVEKLDENNEPIKSCKDKQLMNQFMSAVRKADNALNS